MATIANIANKVNSCSGGSANTGKLGCNVEFSTPAHLIGLKAGTIIPAATIFNQAYINGLVQAGTAVPLIGADVFEDLSAEDTMFTASSGVEKLSLKGLPKYKLTYYEGHEFYREISKLEGFKNLDFLIGDVEGNWMLVKRSDDDFKGFASGMVLPEMRKARVQGGDPESKSIIVQFLSRKEWDENYDILLRDNLENDPEDLQGVNGVNLSFDVVPSDTDTTIVVSALLSADNSTLIEGLDVDDFLYTVDGATEVPTLVSETNGVYTFTVTALATSGVITVQLYDSSANKNVIIETSGATYRSNIITATVV